MNSTKKSAMKLTCFTIPKALILSTDCPHFIYKSFILFFIVWIKRDMKYSDANTILVVIGETNQSPDHHSNLTLKTRNKHWKLLKVLMQSYQIFQVVHVVVNFSINIKSLLVNTILIQNSNIYTQQFIIIIIMIIIIVIIIIITTTTTIIITTTIYYLIFELGHS